MRHPARLLLALAVAATTLGACNRFRYKPAELSPDGRRVVLLMNTAVGGECTLVGQVEARNIHGDPKFMRNKLRNDAAQKGANVVRIDNWAPRVYASGSALRCPEAVADALAMREPQPEGETPDRTPAAQAWDLGGGAAGPAAPGSADAGVPPVMPAPPAPDAPDVPAPPAPEAVAPETGLPADDLPPPPPPK